MQVEFTREELEIISDAMLELHEMLRNDRPWDYEEYLAEVAAVRNKVNAMLVVVEDGE